MVGPFARGGHAGYCVPVQGFGAKETPRGEGGAEGGILDARKSAVAPYTRPGLGGYFITVIIIEPTKWVALSLEIGKGRQGFL